MIELESTLWGQLNHAYGKASDIPALLAQLADYPSNTSDKAEPYFSLWSALCHQGDTYSASYAAVPHIVNLALENPNKISSDYLLLPTAIEISRQSGSGVKLSDAESKPYKQSIVMLSHIVGKLQFSDIEDTWANVASAAVAVSAGHTKLANAILLLEGSAIDEFAGWMENR